MLILGVMLSMIGLGLVLGGIAASWVNSAQNDGGKSTHPGKESPSVHLLSLLLTFVDFHRRLSIILLIKAAIIGAPFERMSCNNRNASLRIPSAPVMRPSQANARGSTPLEHDQRDEKNAHGRKEPGDGGSVVFSNDRFRCCSEDAPLTVLTCNRVAVAVVHKTQRAPAGDRHSQQQGPWDASYDSSEKRRTSAERGQGHEERDEHDYRQDAGQYPKDLFGNIQRLVLGNEF
ncbi:hypothetical protein [Pseudarthrobacter sp. AB1]|uniref:hypothetical protein n=1 Tax=Pseudarthrobacter sp. AB1 TaxID=2138309 RepID=UPI002105561D|nr:hypothetical protein [Pseudarthrobacter sp. AB1]